MKGIKRCIACPRNLIMALLVAVLLTLVQARGLLDSTLIPFGDGGSFYKYALRLYGMLHSGQWMAFLDLLAEPTKNLFPTSILFLFLPANFATSAGYGFVNSLGAHVFLAIGVYLFLRSLKAESLTIAILLLTCANVLAFDPTYYFYMDFAFSALVIMSLGMGAIAVRDPCRRNMIWAGICAAIPFLAKPSNAFITLGLLGLFMAGALITRVVQEKRERWLPFIGRLIGLWSAGFIPGVLLAAYLGGFETILNQIGAYTLHDGWLTQMSETGITRWLYFPLCLSFYYSIPFVLGFSIALLICRYAFQGKIAVWLRAVPPDHSERLVKVILFWSVVSFVILYGLYFSFVLQTKVIRSLPFMLPILWVALLIGTPLRHLRASVVTLFSLMFFCVVWMQAETGMVVDKVNRSAVYYEIKGDWYNRWPARRPDLTQGAAITHHLYRLLQQAGVQEGKVAVGSQMMFWGPGDLGTVCNQNALRRGEPEAYIFTNFGSVEDFPPVRHQYENVNALLLVLEPGAQYSRVIYEQNVRLANHALGVWNGSVADVLLTRNARGDPSVGVVAFYDVFTDELLEDAREKGVLQIKDAVETQRLSRFSEASLWHKLRMLLSRGRDTDEITD